MTTLKEAITKLEEIKKYALEPSYSKLAPDEKKIQPTDSPVIKRLKTALFLEDDIKVIVDKWGKKDLVELNASIEKKTNDLASRDKDIVTINTKWKVKDLTELDTNIEKKTNDLASRDKDIATILNKWGKTDLVKLSDSIQIRDNNIDNLNKQITSKDGILNQANLLFEGVIDSKITFTETDLEVKPEDNEIIKKLKTFLGRKRTDTGTSTSTDDTTDTMMEGYKIMNTKIRINVLDLDIHNSQKLNSSIRIETDDFTVFTRQEKDGEGLINKDPVNCEGIICYGSYDDIKVLEQYNGKDITFTFDKWKIINKGGRNWLYIIHTDNWVFVKLADAITETELTMADIERMESDSQDLEIVINQLETLTTYKKEAKLRAKALVQDLRITKAVKTWLESEGANYKKSISEFKTEAAKKDLTEKELIAKMKELEKKLIKPKMVTTGTQTELTMVELAEMENTVKSLSQSLVDYKIVTPGSRGGDDILFRLDIIERGVSSLEENKEHSETRGQNLKEQLETLAKEVSSGKMTENELNKKVYELEQQIKKKESEYQKQLQIGEEKWKELRIELEKRQDEFVKTEEEKQQLKMFIDRFEATEKEIRKNLKFEKEEKEHFEGLYKQLGKDIDIYKHDIKRLVTDVIKYRGVLLFGENQVGNNFEAVQWLTLMDMYRNAPVVSFCFGYFTQACAKPAIKDLYVSFVEQIIKGSTYPSYLVFDGRFGNAWPMSCNVDLNVEKSMYQSIYVREPYLFHKIDPINIKINFIGRKMPEKYRNVYEDQPEELFKMSQLTRYRRQGFEGNYFKLNLSMNSTSSNSFSVSVTG